MFPEHKIFNWVQHRVKRIEGKNGTVCLRCGFATIPNAAVRDDRTAYVKESRWCGPQLPRPLNWSPCEHFHLMVTESRT